MNPSSRAVRALVLLYRAPRTKEELATELSCCTRTVTRVLRNLGAAGVRVESQDDDRGFQSALPRVYWVTSLDLGPAEVRR